MAEGGGDEESRFAFLVWLVHIRPGLQYEESDDVKVYLLGGGIKRCARGADMFVDICPESVLDEPSARDEASR